MDVTPPVDDLPAELTAETAQWARDFLTRAARDRDTARQQRVVAALLAEYERGR